MGGNVIKTIIGIAASILFIILILYLCGACITNIAIKYFKEMH